MLDEQIPWTRKLNDDALFMEGTVKRMHGFLDDYAAKRTIDLLNFQKKSDIKGSLYEVGLYYGKYFSLIVRSAASMGSRVVGVDTFEYVNINEFNTYFDDKFDLTDLTATTGLDLEIICASSGDMSENELRSRLRSDARFISIDGSHEYDDVLWDLRVADRLVAAAGLIVVDDFLHPISLGVTAAVYEFIFANATLVPFAYVANKLFLCRSAWADRYRTALEQAILADRDDPKSEEYRRHLEANECRHIESLFRGYRVLTVRL